MTDEQDRNKQREVKVYFTQEEIDRIDAARHALKKTIRSRNHLFHLAVEFFLESVRRTGGNITVGQGFPVPDAAEQHLDYESRGHPNHKKKGAE